MKVSLRLDRNMRIIGTNELNLETYFDTHPEVGGEDSAPTPMEIMLEALGSCAYLDVVSILRKKRKQVNDLRVFIEGERAKEHPKVFIKAHMIYELHSPDATLEDLNRALDISQEKYCSISAMFRKSGCEVTWETRLVQE